MRKVWQCLRNENVMSGDSFRGKNEKLSSNADVLHKTQICSFHVVVLLATAKK